MDKRTLNFLLAGAVGLGIAAGSIGLARQNAASRLQDHFGASALTTITQAADVQVYRLKP